MVPQNIPVKDLYWIIQNNSRSETVCKAIGMESSKSKGNNHCIYLINTYIIEVNNDLIQDTQTFHTITSCFQLHVELREIADIRKQHRHARRRLCIQILEITETKIYKKERKSLIIK